MGQSLPPHTRLFAVNSFHPSVHFCADRTVPLIKRTTKLIAVVARKACALVFQAHHLRTQPQKTRLAQKSQATKDSRTELGVAPHTACVHTHRRTYSALPVVSLFMPHLPARSLFSQLQFQSTRSNAGTGLHFGLQFRQDNLEATEWIGKKLET